MTGAPGSINPADRLRDQAVAALVPFFVDGPSDDLATARLAVVGLLDGYQAATPKELQLSAQIVAFSWAAMACLRTAMAAKNLSIEEILRLQDHAIALDRSAQKATKALEGRRKERARHPKAMTAENVQWDEGAFQLAINHALEKLNEANDKLSAYIATVAPAPVKTKLPILSTELMTPSVLARRARH